jgi:uncharacterized protein YecE (DUF72 family)
MAPKYFLGTSGWHYDHWRGQFYPPELPKKDWLAFYAQHFNSVEINYSFYHLPLESTFTNWHETVPRRFCFAVKASRYITHIKRLKDSQDSLQKFTDRAKCLKENLGPILYQFPEGFHRDDARLEEFLTLLDKKLRHVFEFRHRSWMEDNVFNLLHKYNAALCIFDMPGFTSPMEITTDFSYVRFHGKGELYSGSYPDNDLADWAAKLHQASAALKTIYIYFNNDAGGYAVQNALTLRKNLEKAETRVNNR